MPRHLIVSCGTSQTDEKKLNLVLNKLGSNEKRQLKDFFSGVKGNTNRVDGDTPRVWAEKTDAGVFIRHLANRWSDLPGFIGNDANIFGAEISTLAKMSEKGGFAPGEDSVSILYSETTEGALCAGILRKLLCHEQAWNIDPTRVKPILVEGLREYSGTDESTGKGEENLWTCIDRSLKSNGVDNVLVVTGGFKSVIPIFTISALAHHIPMYYLFEKSPNLRELHLVARVEKVEKWWSGNELHFELEPAGSTLPEAKA